MLFYSMIRSFERSEKTAISAGVVEGLPAAVVEHQVKSPGLNGHRVDGQPVGTVALISKRLSKA